MSTLSPFDDEAESLPLEQKLWRKVLIRAWDEAHGRHIYTGNTAVAIEVYHARKWLTRDSRGLREVLEMAGFDKEDMKRLIQHCREVLGNVGMRKTNE